MMSPENDFDEFNFEEIPGTPPELRKMAQEMDQNSMPIKSMHRYDVAYQKFIEWKTSKNATSFSEDVVLPYFGFLANEQQYKPTTLWSVYSMLKCTLRKKHGVNISRYSRLIEFLSRKKVGFKSTKSAVFESQDVEKFLKEAPDEIYLCAKVIMIFGIAGGCRGGELPNIKIDDIKEQGSLLHVYVQETKTYILRSFVIDGLFVDYVKRYAALRPKKVETNRFFLNYQKGKCTSQVIGKNKFAATPKDIATYLNLPSPERYTGHSFRRTSATLLANANVDVRTLQRHGGWKSPVVAEGYVADSLQSKRKISNLITQDINLLSTRNRTDLQSKRVKTASSTVTSSSKEIAVENTSPNAQYNIQNCTVNFYK